MNFPPNCNETVSPTIPNHCTPTPTHDADKNICFQSYLSNWFLQICHLCLFADLSLLLCFTSAVLNYSWREGCYTGTILHMWILTALYSAGLYISFIHTLTPGSFPWSLRSSIMLNHSRVVYSCAFEFHDLKCAAEVCAQRQSLTLFVLHKENYDSEVRCMHTVCVCGFMHPLNKRGFWMHLCVKVGVCVLHASPSA